MTTLHLGTFDADALRDSIPRDLVMIRDGDSWEEWGEPLSKHSDHPEHIILRTTDPDTGAPELMTDVTFLITVASELLVPMGYRSQAGTIACITPDDDWSEPVYTVIDVQAQRFARSLASLRETDDYQPWSDPSWQDHVNEGIAQ